MTNKTDTFSKWQFDKKIPIGILVAMILQTLTAIWWVAKLDSRVLVHETWIEDNKDLAEKVFRLEERILNLQQDINQITNRGHHDH